MKKKDRKEQDQRTVIDLKMKEKLSKRWKEWKIKWMNKSIGMDNLRCRLQRGSKS